MYARIVSIKLLCACLLLALSFAGADAVADSQAPSVRALLFYGPDCAECGELFRYFLPGLFELYGGRLEVAGVDVGQRTGEALYGAAAQGFHLPPRWPGAPVILVGDKAMVGLVAISRGLGDGFDRTAEDPKAADWPPLPGLAALLPTAVADLKARVAREGALPSPSPGPRQPAADRDRIANGLAILVLVGMALALVHSLVRVGRADGKPRQSPAPLLLAVMLIGLGISGYTAYTALADVAPMCGPIGSCASVQHSNYAKLFGIPMGVLGLLGYGAILASWLAARRLSRRGGGWRWLPWAIALFGVLFSMRLTALEAFVIGATCLWCLGSAVSITVTLWLLSAETRPREGPTEVSPTPVH
jgi:uncharacterized membrane protein